MFGFQLLKDNDGNMELTNNIYLQELGYWEQFTKRSIISNSNQTELYFEEPNIEQFVERLETLYPEIEYVNHLMTHSWGQKVVRFYDLDGNLIEVGTPVIWIPIYLAALYNKSGCFQKKVFALCIKMVHLCK